MVDAWSDLGRLGPLGQLGEQLGATKSVEVGRSGSVGSVLGARTPESTGGNSYRDDNDNDNNNDDNNNNNNNNKK